MTGLEHLNLAILALGENEVLGFERISALLRASGVKHDVFTLHRRLLRPGMKSLLDFSPTDRHRAAAQTLLRSPELPAPAYAAAYDRQWRRAGWGARRCHAELVAEHIHAAFDDRGYTAFVSSVGGETSRVVSDLYFRQQGIACHYFNLVPIPQRHVILPALDAPFIPYVAEQARVGPPPLDALDGVATANFAPLVPPSRHQLSLRSPVEGFDRALSVYRRERGVLPIGWPLWRAGDVLSSHWRPRVLRRWGLPSVGELPHPVVLFPLHDEPDFQVAVRERHAVPQMALIRYLASRLPPSVTLAVRPHPSHFGGVGLNRLREVRSIPNVEVVSPWEPASDAIAGAAVVATLASSMGFEALQQGVPVVCYGSPFYSRRGVTNDVRDPRDLAEACVNSIGASPDPDLVASLVMLTYSHSASGSWYPLDLGEANIALLARSLLESLSLSRSVGAE